MPSRPFWPRARREARRTTLGLLFISPWLIGFLWLQLYPIGASLYYSFTEFSLLGDPVWIGFDNYEEMFTDDTLYWKSVRNTLYYAAVSVPLNTIIGISLALLLNANVKGMSIYRTLYYVPTVVPFVASVMLWAWILNPGVGPVNFFLEQIGIQGPGWLNDPDWSKPALIILGLWGAGASVVIYLAGLQDVPSHLYEAAELDGAGWLRKTWDITIPLITPVILFNVLIAMIGAFQYFTQAIVAQAFGGPLNSLLFYNLYLYENAFGYFRMGYASAMAWVLLLVVVAASLTILRSSRRWVHYGR